MHRSRLAAGLPGTLSLAAVQVSLLKTVVRQETCREIPPSSQSCPILSLQPFVLLQNGALNPQQTVAPHLKGSQEAEESGPCCFAGNISRTYQFLERAMVHFCSHGCRAISTARSSSVM